MPVTIHTPDRLWRQRVRALAHRFMPDEAEPSETWNEAIVEVAGQRMTLSRDGDWWVAEIVGDQTVLAQGTTMESAIARVLATVPDR